MKEKKQEKVEQYQELKWSGDFGNAEKVAVIPIIIGALGTINWDFWTWTRKLQMENYCSLIAEKACLFGTAKIIRKALDT